MGVVSSLKNKQLGLIVSLHDLTRGGYVQKVGHGRGVRWTLIDANAKALPPGKSWNLGALPALGPRDISWLT